MVAVTIKWRGAQYIFISAYFDIRQNIQENLAQLENVINAYRNQNIVIAVDSNARSAVWHDIVTNARGSALVEFIITNNLYILNEDSEMSTFETIRVKSIIDLTIRSGNMLRLV